MNTFICSKCGKEKPVPNNGGTGYASDEEGNKTCYDCCAIIDGEELANMPIGGKTIQYWNGKHITNWPGTLKIEPSYLRIGKHNIAGTRTSIWFEYAGNKFYACQMGGFNQIARIRRIKK